MFTNIRKVVCELLNDEIIRITSDEEKRPSERRSIACSSKYLPVIGQRNFANEELHSSAKQGWKDLVSRPIWGHAQTIRESNAQKSREIIILGGTPGSGKSLLGLHILGCPWGAAQPCILVCLPTVVEALALATNFGQLQTSIDGEHHSHSCTGLTGWQKDDSEEYIRIVTPMLALSMLSDFTGQIPVLFIDEWDYRNAYMIVLKALGSWRTVVKQNLWVYGACAGCLGGTMDIGSAEAVTYRVVDVSVRAHRRLDLVISFDVNLLEEIVARLCSAVPLGCCGIVFLPGKEMINSLSSILSLDKENEVIPMYSDHPSLNKNRVRIGNCIPAEKRRIIIATDIIGRAVTVTKTVASIVWPWRNAPFFKNGAKGLVLQPMLSNDLNNLLGRAARDGEGWTVVLQTTGRVSTEDEIHEGRTIISMQDAPSFLISMEYALRKAGATLEAICEYNEDTAILANGTWVTVVRKLLQLGCFRPIEQPQQLPFVTEFGDPSSLAELLRELPVTMDHALILVDACDPMNGVDVQAMFVLATDTVALLQLTEEGTEINLKGESLAEAVEAVKKAVKKANAAQGSGRRLNMNSLVNKLQSKHDMINAFWETLTEGQRQRQRGSVVTPSFQASGEQMTEVEKKVLALVGKHCPRMLALPCPCLGTNLFVSYEGAVFKNKENNVSEEARLVIQSKAVWNATLKSLGSQSIWEAQLEQGNAKFTFTGTVQPACGRRLSLARFCAIFIDSMSQIYYSHDRQSQASEICQLVAQNVGWPLPFFRGGMKFAECAAWLYRLTTKSDVDVEPLPFALIWLNVNELVNRKQICIPPWWNEYLREFMTFVAARVKAGVVITCKCVFPAYAQYKEVYDMAVGAVAQMVERFKALASMYINVYRCT